MNTYGYNVSDSQKPILPFNLDIRSLPFSHCLPNCAVSFGLCCVLVILWTCFKLKMYNNLNVHRWMNKNVIHTHTHREYYSNIKDNEILPFATTWMDLKVIMLSKIKKKENNKSIWSLLYVESKKNKTEQLQKNNNLIDTENRLVFARGRGWLSQK